MKNKRFNLFDLLIIIIVIGVILGIIFRTQIKDTLFSADSAVFEVTIEVESMPNACASAIAEGTELYISKSENLFGKVVSITVTPVSETVFVGDQEVEAQSEYYSSAVIVIRTEGYVSDGMYFSKTEDALLIKSEFNLETKSLYFNGKISNVTVVENNN